jgi:hypothetical protein
VQRIQRPRVLGCLGNSFELACSVMWSAVRLGADCSQGGRGDGNRGAGHGLGVSPSPMLLMPSEDPARRWGFRIPSLNGW